mmetsp:Transcript_11069/g.36167  ORF Transcript_11069/g.36167 Transcript_11069/m.36167 type:complete len:174 (+) Transcript_11069:331-852(+)
MERGSLEDCLRAHPAEFRWERLGRRVLLDTAKGLLYLHGRGLVHFDVKPLNILVSAHNVAKLSDVGLTKKLNNTLTRPGGWTPAYAAPEILARQGANETSDIYSFGLVVWQVYTHRVPSPFEPCRVAASWPVAPLLVGAGREHEGALALDKERRPSGVHLKDELDALAAGGGP